MVDRLIINVKVKKQREAAAGEALLTVKVRLVARIQSGRLA